MAYPIDKKLVIAVASSALFDLSESDKIYREQGLEAYRKYQRRKRMLRWLQACFPVSERLCA